FLLLLQEPLQRFRHGVERGFKRRKLISGLHANAVDQVSAIDVLSGAIQCAHRSRDCSREPHANNQRYQFDNRECDRNHHQQYEDRRTYLSQIGKDAAVQNRWASAYVHRRASLFSRTPLDGGKYRSKLQHGIESVNLRRSYSTAYRRHRSHIFVIAFAELEGSLTIFPAGLLEVVQRNHAEVGHCTRKQFRSYRHQNHQLQVAGSCWCLPIAANEEFPIEG